MYSFQVSLMWEEEQQLLPNFLDKLVTSLSDERWEETDKAFHVACSFSGSFLCPAARDLCLMEWYKEDEGE